MMSPPKLRVAICGGGISGLCLALLLSKYPDIQVDLFEAAERFKEIGAGVMIWSRTWKIIELMGLASEFSHTAHAPPDGSLGIGFDYRRSDQGPAEGFQFHLVEMPYGCIRFHRAHFLDVFVSRLPDGVAHFGKRLLSYSGSRVPGDPINLSFSDNSTSSCDLLVGCDGIKSLVRAQMFETKAAQDGDPSLMRYIEPIWSGTIAYRGLIPVEQLPITSDGLDHRTLYRPMMYCGKDKHVVSYPISQGTVVNVVTFASSPEKEGTLYDGPWVTDCSAGELLDCYAGWESDVDDLLKCIKHPTRWAIHQLQPLPFYVTDKLALVGDAAHAMAPHQGAGAGQAIEDAFILAHLLGNRLTSTPTLQHALSVYEQVRLPVANGVLRGSRDSGLMYEFNSEYGEDYKVLGPMIERQWDWISKTTPEEELETALELLRVKVCLQAAE